MYKLKAPERLNLTSSMQDEEDEQGVASSER